MEDPRRDMERLAMKLQDIWSITTYLTTNKHENVLPAQCDAPKIILKWRTPSRDTKRLAIKLHDIQSIPTCLTTISMRALMYNYHNYIATVLSMYIEVSPHD